MEDADTVVPWVLKKLDNSDHWSEKGLRHRKDELLRELRGPQTDASSEI
jgi:hypothetical protein